MFSSAGSNNINQYHIFHWRHKLYKQVLQFTVTPAWLEAIAAWTSTTWCGFLQKQSFVAHWHNDPAFVFINHFLSPFIWSKFKQAIVSYRGCIQVNLLPISLFHTNMHNPLQLTKKWTRDDSWCWLCCCHPPMLWVTILSLSSNSPRAISSVFIHRIILQRASGRPAAQPTDTFTGRRDSLPAFSWTVLRRADDGEEDRRRGMQQGELAQDVTAWLRSCAPQGCWRIEGERGGVCAARRRWDACEKWMLSRMARMLQRRMREWCLSCYGSDSPSCTDESASEGCGAQGAGNGDGEEVERKRQPHSHMHASASAHMMVQTCADLAHREGEGKWRSTLRFYTNSWSNSDIQCGVKA